MDSNPTASERRSRASIASLLPSLGWMELGNRMSWMQFASCWESRIWARWGLRNGNQKCGKPLHIFVGSFKVRATSLQELVYKGGQCGVTKATVTLVFDNTNPAQFPIGYEKCREIMVSRQVVVGGKNKYMINGKAVINKKVSDLFCSVQLNINNPNFLIMQGRITKVLNMKPAEVCNSYFRYLIQ